MKPIFLNNCDDDNLGDRICSPRIYFDAWKDCPHSDWRRFDLDAGDEPLIIGASGMLHPPLISGFVAEAVRRRRVILWGIGHNVHTDEGESYDYSGFDWKRIVEGAELGGLRDRKLAEENGYHWTPCPTVMDPAFDEIPDNPGNGEVFVYSHRHFPIPLLQLNPLCNAASEVLSITNFRNRIAGFETVLTNSYHGALWALLFRRRVVLWRPFSTKFFTGLPELPVAHGFKGLKELFECDYVTESVVEYRRATQVFYYRVESYLARWGCE